MMKTKSTKAMFLLCLTITVGGCGGTNHKKVAMLTYGLPKSQGKLTDTLVWQAGGIALDVGRPQIPGAPPNGIGAGIYAAKMLTSGSYLELVKNSNHLEAWMPANEASDEEGAALKMSAIMESAVRKAFLPPYQTKIFEFENEAVFGAVDQHRYIRVNGPGCENWSCLASAPIPTQPGWVGQMTKTECVEDGTSKTAHSCYAYDGLFGIGFGKITEEHDETGLINGHWHKIQSKLVEGFDYEQLFLRISKNLPDWVFFYIAPNVGKKDEPLKGPALLNKGVKIKI
jgi:hypothetical protein